MVTISHKLRLNNAFSAPLTAPYVNDLQGYSVQQLGKFFLRPLFGSEISHHGLAKDVSRVHLGVDYAGLYQTYNIEEAVFGKGTNSRQNDLV